MGLTTAPAALGMSSVRDTRRREKWTPSSKLMPEQKRHVVEYLKSLERRPPRRHRRSSHAGDGGRGAVVGGEAPTSRSHRRQAVSVRLERLQVEDERQRRHEREAPVV